MPFDFLRSLGAKSPLMNQLPKGPYYGVLAEFATPTDLYHACERVRDEGFTRWDAHTPLPVHEDRSQATRRAPFALVPVRPGCAVEPASFVARILNAV